MDNQESTSPTLNGGGHLPDGLFPHVLLRLREVKDENASLREDNAANSTLIENITDRLNALDTELTAFRTEHNALQTRQTDRLNAFHTELTAFRTGHIALLTEHNALQTRHARLRSLINLINFGIAMVAIGMVLDKWLDRK